MEGNSVVNFSNEVAAEETVAMINAAVVVNLVRKDFKNTGLIFKG
jgi:hypothetical protein